MRQAERGAISLFIVIFTMLLVTVVTVSFTQIMIRNQQQVTASDLSQRAYDSAMSGVEDAKRLLVQREKVCSSSDPTDQTSCDNLNDIIKNKKCTTIQDAGIANASIPTDKNAEIQVGQASDNQAYTCVKIDTDTDSYQDDLQSGEPTVLPLKATEKFNRVKVSWFTSEDAGDTTNISYPPTVNTNQLPQASAWSSNGTTPPILRVQYIPGNTPTKDLDKDAHTMMLYPQKPSDVGPGRLKFSDDARRSGSFSPSPVACQPNFEENTAGVCSATIELPESTQSSFLQVAPIYGSTYFTVQLYKDDELLKFHDVQPAVDSTGRADNLFRRVLAHVTVKNGVTTAYPDGTLHVSNNLCKTFFITDDKSDYQQGDCKPDETN